MSGNDTYFQSKGFASEAAWENERQERCDRALKEIEEAARVAMTKDADTRRSELVRIHAIFKGWTNWILDSQR